MATPSPIVVSVSGKTVAEVRAALIALGNALGGEAIQHVELAEDAVEAKVHVKNNTKAKAAPAGEEAQPGPTPEEEAQPAPAPDNHVADMDPATARKQGIDMMQAFFSENPDKMPALTKLQKEFGVAKFVEIPDDKALDFLAEVKLIVSGAAHA